MADSFTTNLVLVKPEVGASTDTWGTKLNANLDVIDGCYNSNKALLLTNGGTGATTAAAARANLGCGTMAVQNANTVAVTGGTASGVAVTGSTIDSTPIGASIPNTVKATSIQLVAGSITFPDGTNQASSASALNSPSVFNIAVSGTVSAVPISQTEKLDASSGALTRILPSAVGLAGHQVTGKKMDSTANGISYAATASQTIDGVASFALFRQFDAVTFQSDGANWILI